MLAEMLHLGLQIIQPRLDRKRVLYLQQPQQIIQLLASDMKEELMHLDSMLVKALKAVVSTMLLRGCASATMEGCW